MPDSRSTDRSRSPAPSLSTNDRAARLAPLTTQRSPLERAFRWLHDGTWSAAERVRRGARHVHIGLGLAIAGLLGWLGVILAAGYRWDWRILGLLVTYGIAAMGVLAGSRVARFAMLVHALSAWAILRMMLVVLSGFRDGFQFRPLLTAMAAGLYLAGTALANLTPAANAYYAAQRARREERRKAKRKSLADWRKSGG